MIITDLELFTIQRIVKLEKSKHPEWIDEFSYVALDAIKKSINQHDAYTILLGKKSTDKVEFRKKYFLKTVLIMEPETEEKWARLRLINRVDE